MTEFERASIVPTPIFQRILTATGSRNFRFSSFYYRTCQLSYIQDIIDAGCPESLEFTQTSDLILENLNSCSSRRRVFGGVEVNPSTWPWVAKIDIHNPIGDLSLCSGTILDDFWVLTAAGCCTGGSGRILQTLNIKNVQMKQLKIHLQLNLNIWGCGIRNFPKKPYPVCFKSCFQSWVKIFREISYFTSPYKIWPHSVFSRFVITSF